MGKYALLKRAKNRKNKLAVWSHCVPHNMNSALEGRYSHGIGEDEDDKGNDDPR